MVSHCFGVVSLRGKRSHLRRKEEQWRRVRRQKEEPVELSVLAPAVASSSLLSNGGKGHIGPRHCFQPASLLPGDPLGFADADDSQGTWPS
ncbi:hypothetical protein GW17_00024228 [Ensete ventricosum]|uniref:Uncharacterized protein n=1 Tax=Ensete ventricosum TaxID=4639 RepID=A0A444EP43_ENSVE|nr:hypothetical protein B296_00032390 [Ensete ventricosum]RWW12122.1 hypothetical protein GW17_00024228 [Ensete ventricosum]